MRRQMSLTALTFGVLLALAVGTGMTLLARPLSVTPQGANQIAGIAFFADAGECTDPEGLGATFALRMTGDLEGCHYVFVDSHECSPSGTYREAGTEIFVGHYNGAFGTFDTTYQFSAKYDDCPNLLGEIFGRCEHPVTKDTGTGVFAGFTGRLDFKDDVQAGNFPYRGHLRN